MNNGLDLIADYIKAKECKNDNAFYICHKCGKCGRRFNPFGLMIDDGGTSVEEDEEM